MTLQAPPEHHHHRLQLMSTSLFLLAHLSALHPWMGPTVQFLQELVSWQPVGSLAALLHLRYHLPSHSNTSALTCRNTNITSRRSSSIERTGVVVATGVRWAASSAQRARTGNGIATRTHPPSHLTSLCLPHIWWTHHCHPLPPDSTTIHDSVRATTGNVSVRAMPPHKTWPASPGLTNVHHHCQP
jgi:hypothetical protein